MGAVLPAALVLADLPQFHHSLSLSPSTPTVFFLLPRPYTFTSLLFHYDNFREFLSVEGEREESGEEDGKKRSQFVCVFCFVLFFVPVFSFLLRE